MQTQRRNFQQMKAIDLEDGGDVLAPVSSRIDPRRRQQSQSQSQQKQAGRPAFLPHLFTGDLLD